MITQKSYYLKINIMKHLVYILFIILSLSTTKAIAQEIKFGKISKKELDEKFYPQDTSANAVVLFKKRRTTFEYNKLTGWTLKTVIHERIKLYNKDGFNSANKKVRLFTQNGKSETFTVKAYTYNLEQGKVIKTKLSNKAVFQEEVSKYWNSRNFTMPDLQEGSVIEWEYVIYSPYYSNIDNIVYQYDIPIKHVEAYLQIPDQFRFKYLSSRYYPIKVKESRVQKDYTISNTSRSEYLVVKSTTSYERTTLDENIYEVLLNNVPALVEEPYTSNINNYRGEIDFEIVAYVPKYGESKYYNTNWKDITKNIYDSSRFGDQLNRNNHFSDDLAVITTGPESDQEKINSIFNLVKAKIKWNEEYGKYVSSKGIKNAYQEGVGNVADINLTLVSMLREAGFNSNPVLVSTRSHGIPLFPTNEGFNYVIACIESPKGTILMDATEKYSTPDVLPLRVLNWQGRIIRENGTSTEVDLYPTKYNAKNIKLSVKIDEEGTLSGTMANRYLKLYALNFRDEYNSLSEESLISRLESKFGGIEIDQIRVRNKEKPFKPIDEFIQFSKDNQADIIGDKIYISPLLFLTVQENPFTLEKRTYPIDYGSAWKDRIEISLQIPEGFNIESKPENISLVLPENLGSYSMEITFVDKKINIRSTININKALIGANNYTVLKELYKRAINNQLEKIVLVRS